MGVRPRGKRSPHLAGAIVRRTLHTRPQVLDRLSTSANSAGWCSAPGDAAAPSFRDGPFSEASVPDDDGREAVLQWQTKVLVAPAAPDSRCRFMRQARPGRPGSLRDVRLVEFGPTTWRAHRPVTEASVERCPRARSSERPELVDTRHDLRERAALMSPGARSSRGTTRRTSIPAHHGMRRCSRAEQLARTAARRR